MEIVPLVTRGNFSDCHRDVWIGDRFPAFVELLPWPNSNPRHMFYYLKVGLLPSWFLGQHSDESLAGHLVTIHTLHGLEGK